MQKKTNSFFESFLNTIIGLVTSFVVQIVAYPLMDIEVTLFQNLTLTSIFFTISVLRGYLIRRYYNGKK